MLIMSWTLTCTTSEMDLMAVGQRLISSMMRHCVATLGMVNRGHTRY